MLQKILSKLNYHAVYSTWNTTSNSIATCIKFFLDLLKQFYHVTKHISTSLNMCPTISYSCIEMWYSHHFELCSSGFTVLQMKEDMKSAFAMATQSLQKLRLKCTPVNQLLNHFMDLFQFNIVIMLNCL